MKLSNQTNRLLVGAVILQGMILLGQWSRSAGAAHDSGVLNLPDPGARQLQMIEELKNLNAKTDKLLDLLQSGGLQVKVAEADKK